MDGRARTTLNYLDRLKRFHAQQGTRFTGVPILNQTPIDLLELKKLVEAKGGFELVTRKKSWAEIGRSFGLHYKNCTSVSFSLRKIYQRIIMPYEDFMSNNASAAGRQSANENAIKSESASPEAKTEPSSPVDSLASHNLQLNPPQAPETATNKRKRQAEDDCDYPEASQNNSAQLSPPSSSSSIDPSSTAINTASQNPSASSSMHVSPSHQHSNAFSATKQEPEPLGAKKTRSTVRIADMLNSYDDEFQDGNDVVMQDAQQPQKNSAETNQPSTRSQRHRRTVSNFSKNMNDMEEDEDEYASGDNNDAEEDYASGTSSMRRSKRLSRKPQSTSQASRSIRNPTTTSSAESQNDENSKNDESRPKRTNHRRVSKRISQTGLSKITYAESDSDDTVDRPTAEDEPYSPAREDGHDDDDEDDSDEGPLPDHCEICQQSYDEGRMLICDECEKGFHLYCLKPPLREVPKSPEWYCARCLLQIGNDYGFEDADGDRSLSEFQKYADAFKDKWFRKHPDAQVGEKGRVIVPEDVAEREYWRLVESPYEEIEIEYGADVHSSLHGSGFPTPERNPGDPYAYCGWNLNNMPILPASLLTHIRSDIPGMMVPWLYIGMIFSTFCWHTEDHFTYSINYLHWGETKTWYGVPSSNAQAFEAAMRKIMPDLFEQNPDLLFHITTIVSPARLREHGVHVVTTDQRPGEFVITFPRSYHAGFNHGFNFAEAVNFALPDWLPHGRACVNEYARYRKQPVFSHDELVVSAARSDPDANCAAQLLKELKIMYCELKMALKQFGNKYTIYENAKPVKEYEPSSSLAPNDCRQCAECLRYCYMYFVTCECASQRVACLEHACATCSKNGKSTDRLNLFLAMHSHELAGIHRAMLFAASSYETYYDMIRNEYLGTTCSVYELPAIIDFVEKAWLLMETIDADEIKRNLIEFHKHLSELDQLFKERPSTEINFRDAVFDDGPNPDIGISISNLLKFVNQKHGHLMTNFNDTILIVWRDRTMRSDELGQLLVQKLLQYNNMPSAQRIESGIMDQISKAFLDLYRCNFKTTVLDGARGILRRLFQQQTNS